MSDSGVDPNDGAPVIPAEFQQYNSYEVDPKYQVYFTLAWTSALALVFVLNIPRLTLAGKNGFVGMFGVSESDGKDVKSKVPSRRRISPPKFLAPILGIAGYTVPFANETIGQSLIAMSLLVAVITLMLHQISLLIYPNRAGFLALSLLPPTFLFAQKSPILLYVLTHQTYAQLNFLHRVSSRLLVVCALVHGSIWLNNHLVYDLPIMGAEKESYGLAALCFLMVIAISSVNPVRRLAYRFFWIMHVVSFPAFVILITYHTPYARPWVYIPTAFYAFDLLLRSLRFRVFDATISPLDPQFTLIHIPHAKAGYRAGDHFHLRVFLEGLKGWESHSLSVACAPKGEGVFELPAPTFAQLAGKAGLREDELTGMHLGAGGMLFGVRVGGDWSRAVNSYASLPALSSPGDSKEDLGPKPLKTLVSLSGPYPSSLPPSLSLSAYDDVLIFAGGSGITFALGVLDTLIGAAYHHPGSGSGRAKVVELNWCIRSYGSIRWFTGYLSRLALAAAAAQEKGGDALEFKINVYVTCLCDPSSVPPIPNLDVRIVDGRLGVNVRKVTDEFLGVGGAAVASDASSLEDEPKKTAPASSSASPTPEVAYAGSTQSLSKTGSKRTGAVCVLASGPSSLVREVGNKVASLRLSKVGREREVAWWGEGYEV